MGYNRYEIFLYRLVILLHGKHFLKSSLCRSSFNAFFLWEELVKCFRLVCIYIIDDIFVILVSNSCQCIGIEWAHMKGGEIFVSRSANAELFCCREANFRVISRFTIEQIAR